MDFRADVLGGDTIQARGARADHLGGTFWFKKSVTADYGVPDTGARILEKTVTASAGVMQISVRLSTVAGLLAWLSDQKIQIGVLLDLEPALEHVFTLRYPASSQDRTLNLNLEIVNP